jgi:hypothetical protein
MLPFLVTNDSGGRTMLLSKFCPWRDKTSPLAELSINPATGKSYRQGKRDSKTKERRRKTAREKKEEFRRNVKAGSVKNA